MKKLHIVMYHYVRDLQHSRYPEIKGLDIRLFKQQIEYFKENFEAVTMEEVMAAYNQSYELPENAVLLTFDDGYIDDFVNIYPILKEAKMQGSFFVPEKTIAEHTLLDVNKIHFILASAPIEKLVVKLYEQLNKYRGTEYVYPGNEELFKKYAVANRFDCKEVIFFKRVLQMVLPEVLRGKIASELFEEIVGVDENIFARELYLNRQQIRCMKNDGMFFGIHGYDHYWMNKLEPVELEADVKKALTLASDYIDANSWVMNYPYGSYSDSVISKIKTMGCKLGLATDVGIANKSSDKYKLPRFDTNDFPPKSDRYKSVISSIS